MSSIAWILVYPERDGPYTSRVFSNPPTPASRLVIGGTICLLIDPKAVALAPYMTFSRYLMLTLATVPKQKGASSGQIKEYGHRIICWATHGPPPSTLKYPVAMHVCNNTECLNPSHIIWGENEENVHPLGLGFRV
jgi:hypothetical protein